VLRLDTGGIAEMTLTSNSSEQHAFQKELDTESIAIIGAVAGLIAGSAYEIGEVFFNHPSEIETFLQIITEIGAATLGGSLLFVVFSTLRNRLK
jgi:hypothetical protein